MNNLVKHGYCQPKHHDDHSLMQQSADQISGLLINTLSGRINFVNVRINTVIQEEASTFGLQII